VKKSWDFGETLTLEVGPDDEINVTVTCNKSYNLVLAAMEMAPQVLGDAVFRVSQVWHKMEAEDRYIDGLMHVTPSIGFDVVLNGKKVGKIHIAFEAKTVPEMSSKSSTIGGLTVFG